MRYVAAIAGLFLLGTASWAASPQLLNLVMPNADTVGGVNLTTAKLSPFGQFLLTRLQSGNAGLSQLTSATGFNPLTDVSEILFAEVSTTKQSGVLAALGTFDPGHIATAVSSDKNAAAGTYDNDPIFTFTNPKSTVTTSIAFIGTNVVVAGQTSAVKAALDRSSATNNPPAALANGINTLSANQDAWIVSDAPISSLLPAGAANSAQAGPAMVMQFLKSITGFDAGVKLGESTVASLDLMADTAQNATALGNVAQMLIGLGASNAGNSSSGSNAQLSALLGILKNATVAVNGSAVAITLSVPESQLEAIVQSLPGN